MNGTSKFFFDVDAFFSWLVTYKRIDFSWLIPLYVVSIFHCIDTDYWRILTFQSLKVNQCFIINKRRSVELFQKLCWTGEVRKYNIWNNWKKRGRCPVSTIRRSPRFLLKVARPQHLGPTTWTYARVFKNMWIWRALFSFFFHFLFNLKPSLRATVSVVVRIGGPFLVSA